MATAQTLPIDLSGTGARRGWQPRLGPFAGFLLAAPMIAIILCFVCYPLVRLFIDAVSGDAGWSRLSLVFSDPISRRALITTVICSLIVACITILLATIIAWTLHATPRRWLRTLLWVTVLVPFAMGTIIKNYAILLLLVANGPFNAALQALGFIDEPVQLLYTPFAVVYGISYSLLPYAVFTLYSVFSTVDLNLLSSSSVLGASRWRSLAGVVLPQVRGGIAVSFALVFVLSIGFYVAPLVLGGLQTPFMAVQINQQIFAMYDYPGASASAFVLLLIAVVALAAALLAGGKSAFKGVMTR